MLEPGLDERELAVRYAHAAGALTPMVEPLLGNLLKLHLSKLVQTELISAEEREAGRLPGARDVAVAFADLVGFTRLGEEVPPDELGAVAGRLEELVLDVDRAAGALRQDDRRRGDGGQPRAPSRCSTRALRLVEAADAEGESFPQLRAGLASGEALSRAGDWFGRPVNLASRVTRSPTPGSVLATDDVREAADGSAGPRRASRLKGVEDAVPLWRARRQEAATARAAVERARALVAVAVPSAVDRTFLADDRAWWSRSALEVHERHAVAARVGDPRDVDDDDRAARLGDRRVLEGGPARSSSAKRGSPSRTTSPRPCRRRIRGGPSKAQSITTMRPFSRRWPIVSVPLP